MNNALVTGANGFVGYWLTRELVNNGVHVTAIIKDEHENISMLQGLDNIDFVYCDLSELLSLPKQIKSRTYDVMYHLAWISAGGPGRADYNIQLNNVRYSCDAVKVAHQLGCRKVLFAGTITEKIAENTLNISTVAVNNIYGICKHTTHCLVDIEAKRLGIDYVWMQFSNLYGPYSINGNIVGYTLKELISGNEAKFGPANQPYDLLYIEDLAYAAYLLAISRTLDSCYYIGSGNVKILSEYLLEIGEICDKRNQIIIGARPDDGTRYDADWFNISKLHRDTGYKPRFSLKEGVLNTIEWMIKTK